MKLICISIVLFSSNLLFAQYGVLNVEEEIYYKNDTIRGTYVSAFNKEWAENIPKAPFVIFIPGSGPTDRNGNSQFSASKADVFLRLADSLAKKGISSFRYDKIAVGKSTFNSSEKDLRFEDNVAVVLEIIKQLKAKLKLENIYLMGHSEGSLVAMLSCQKADIKGFISLSGPSQNACSLLKDQMNSNLKEPLLSEAIEKLDSLGNGHQVKKFNIALASLMRTSIQPYLISWFKYTPSKELAKLDCRVLIIQGGRDIQVPKEQGEALATVKGDYLFFPKMNHVCKAVGESREENIAAYSDPDFPFAENFIDQLAKWILEGNKLK
tara:strand:- start:1522 stop:2493 length:972 start_codon:yes stop_codon:yes gene_type:complete